MKFITTNKRFEDTGYLDPSADIDMEIGRGTNNDFQITIRSEVYDVTKIPHNGALYAEGTEYGGIIGDVLSNSQDKRIYITCDTWRGLLCKKIVEPPAGAAYLTVSGDLHSIMSTLLGNALGTLYSVSTTPTGVSVTDWKVSRYVTLLSAYESLLASVGYRLNIAADGSGNTLKIVLSAVPVVDHSEELEVSQDSNVSFIIQQTYRRYTHMICAGSGELENRSIIYLHQLGNGTIERVDGIPYGLDVMTYLYDYPSAQSVEELEEYGRKEFSEINKTDYQEVYLEGEDVYPIGDIVGGRDYVTGIYVSQPISAKIIKVEDGLLSVEYKIGV